MNELALFAGAGFLHDDGPEFVKLVIGVQETLERERGPCVDVLFLESGTLEVIS